MRAREGREARREATAGRVSAELRDVKSQTVKRVERFSSTGLPKHLWFNGFILSSSSPTGDFSRGVCFDMCPFARRARARAGFRKLLSQPSKCAVLNGFPFFFFFTVPPALRQSS